MGKKTDELSICQDAREMINKAGEENIETVWDRLKQQQPHCGFCELGLSCTNCVMGPCRIDPFEYGPQKGVCGADADVVVARNFGRMIAAGAASHSDHGRDLLEVLEAVAQGRTPDYGLADPAKLKRIALEAGVAVEGKDDLEVARELAHILFEDFGSRKSSLTFLSRVPEKRIKIWEKLGVVPRGIDREVVEMMHRTHMGVDNDALNLCLHSARVSLSDGWAGSMVATELSDIIFGTPSPLTSKVNLGVLKEDHVNILVHGHSPVVSEMVLAAARDSEFVAKAQEAGAAGINVAGLCCTGNELLMRQGVPMAGNHLMTELVLVTGAVEVIVADYQCIMPSLVNIAGCYHSKIVSTSSKARFTGAVHIEMNVENAREKGREVVALAIETFRNRDKSRVRIPVEPVELMTGFSNEAVLDALGGTPGPLLEAVKAGKIRGVIGIVGCNNPKIKQDYGTFNLARECIKRDILVLVTGCATISTGKQGLLMPEAAGQAGPGLAEVCQALGIPPVLHVGSCVDNSRIMQLCALLANELGVDISDLPVAAAAPEWYSEKAATIGLYAVASGIFTVLGVAPPILGSKFVTDLATRGLEDAFGAAFAVEPDPFAAAQLVDERIKAKRKKLGLTE
nr:anaerobic carbon-monoxide dehydrogenase catalytic subunit [Desulfonatronovibrio hydrogenovorans]